MTSKPSTPESDGPKTETTLTTRIRINIPGSRPIPPVVVRKAMGTSDPAGAATDGGPGAQPAAEPAPAPRTRPEPTRIQAAPEPPPAEGEGPPSNWFAPRKAAAPAPGAGAGGGPGAAPGAGPGAARGGVPTPPPAPAQGSGYPGRAAAPPPAPTPGPAPAPTPPPGPVVGGAGFAPPRTTPPPPVAGAGFPPPRTTPPPPVPGGAAYGQDPAGPRPGGPGGGAPRGVPAYGNGPDDGGPGTEALPAYVDQGSAFPAGPTGGPGFGVAGPLDGPRAAESPRWPGPELDVPAPGPAAVPPPGPTAGPASAARPASRQPAGKGGKGGKGKAKPVKKGRSKLALLGGATIALLGVAYGAGLLLNHSDVPKGTTVLGADISGSRDEAVAKLQTAFGTRATAPLQLSVGGKQVELKPEKAGLTLDSQTTVRNAAGSDYNPVTVIGSLFGQEREATPVMPVDEEKLQVALQELAGTAGSATEGTIKFDTGKAVAVPGTAGTTLDVDASAEHVTKAFRDMVATGKAAVAELPVTTKAPVIDQAELDRAMKEFAEPAMSANATVKIGSKSIAFGGKSLPRILSMTPVEGHLVEKFDLEALKETYGNTFDGILITRGTGEKTAVTPQDVAGALGKALRGKTAAERTVVVDTNPA